MIEFKAEKCPKVAILLNDAVEITFTTTKSVLRQFEGLSERDLTVTVKEYRQKRSLSQNAYLWVLLDQLAQKLNQSKEEVYKTFIRDYGVFEILPIKNEAVESFKHKWAKGLGWFCEDLGDSKLNGYTKLIAYYGSSTYNTKEMTRLIDAVVADCKEQGIDTWALSDIMLLTNDND
jgi:hypothetical protein